MTNSRLAVRRKRNRAPRRRQRSVPQHFKPDPHRGLIRRHRINRNAVRSGIDPRPITGLLLRRNLRIEGTHDSSRARVQRRIRRQRLIPKTRRREETERSVTSSTSERHHPLPPANVPRPAKHPLIRRSPLPHADMQTNTSAEQSILASAFSASIILRCGLDVPSPNRASRKAILAARNIVAPRRVHRAAISRLAACTRSATT